MNPTLHEFAPDLPLDGCAHLFIGGAPRSGTTLLANLLDGHSGILLFPTEHSTLERFFWNRDRIETYAREEFVHHRSQGQQTLLANKDFFETKKRSLSQELEISFDLDIDFSKFKPAYLRYLQNRQVTLQSMLNGLSFAQISANQHSRKHAGQQIKFLVYKQPFFTEVFAQQVALVLSNAKFIHILRDPISRYVSAKTRRLKQMQLIGSRLGPINRLSYVAGHSIIDLTTRKLASDNASALGESMYRLIQFEDLVTSPTQTISSILDWLGLSSEGFPTIPTRMGKPIEAGSTLLSGTRVDSGSLKRSDSYLSITSRSERRVHAWILKDLLSDHRNNRLTIIPDFLLPLPESNWKNYICQLIDLGRSLVWGKPVTVEGFINRVRLGNTQISGAT